MSKHLLAVITLCMLSLVDFEEIATSLKALAMTITNSLNECHICTRLKYIYLLYFMIQIYPPHQISKLFVKKLMVRGNISAY